LGTVDAYRYWEQQGGKRHKRKVILGTADELSREDAERKAEAHRLIANRENPEVGAVTMNALIDRYLITNVPTERPLADSYVQPPQGDEMSLQCARSYRSYIERWIRPRWAVRENGDPYLASDFEHITMSNAIEEWLRSLPKSDRNPSGLAPKTVRGIFVVMKLIFKYAVKWGYISKNPLGNKLVDLPRVRLTKPRTLTPQEYLRMLALFPEAGCSSGPRWDP
jgi:integrase